MKRLKNLRDQIRGGDSPADDAKDAVRGARSTAGSTMREARGATRSAVARARKTARRQYVRGRVAAARATATRRSGTSKKGVAAAGAAGAAGAYFLDPKDGARRRHLVRDKVLALVRKGKEQVVKNEANDQTLADRVKSEIFQPADAPKGSVSVNVERGVVYLRGEVPEEGDIAKLVQQANSVDGINGVESLLHTG